MKLQAREQAIIGGGAILAVLVCGTFGILTKDFAIFPQWDKFVAVQKQLSEVNSEVTAQESTLASLKQEKVSLQGKNVEMPEGKQIGEIKTPETLESTTRELLNTVIEMSLNHENILISAKPGNKPPAPPPPPTTAPNAAPVPQLSNYIEEVPYNITIRGNYTGLNGFINELANYDTVIEIADLKIFPEQNQRGPLVNLQKPLKAEFKIVYLINTGNSTLNP